MATVQVWDVKGRLDHPLNYAANPEKTDKALYSEAELDVLKDVMDYAANNAKTYTTDQQHCVTGINCFWNTARQEMMLIKKQYMDEKEIVALHAFQSFAPGEATPELAHQVGIELAQRMWGDRFQILVATHLNTDCIHNHFVINATSYVDGKRCYDNKDSLKKVRQLSDEICREYGLSVIEHPKSANLPYPVYQSEKAGMPTRYNVARAAIDEAIALSLSMSDFEKKLLKMGYRFQFNDKRKYWTVTPKGWEKPIRLNKLGEEYTKENILQRISDNVPGVVMEKFQHRHKPVNVRFDTFRRATTLRGLYIHYCYELGILPKLQKQNPARLHYLLKDDLLKIDYISQETKFLYQYHIDTAEELMVHSETALGEISSTTHERRQLWNQMRSITDPTELALAKGRASVMTARLKMLRKEVKMCESIQKRVPGMEGRVRQLEKEKNRLLQADKKKE